jgi:ParB/RepB/Spo0J family partition protein
MQVPISEVTVGERRREEMGDLAGLAQSLARYGLLQPIVVDDALRLVAGGRRLEAAKRLGWTSIEVKRLGELTDAERAEIELEENIRRKDFTPIELSKEVVRKAEQLAPVLPSPRPVRFTHTSRTLDIYR